MSRKIKDNIYLSISTLIKALSSPKRIEIIDLLSQGEKTVEEIAQQGDLGIKNASAQLKELKSAQLLGSRKDGKYVYYFLADNSVAHFWIQLRDFSEMRSSELQRITKQSLTSPHDLHAIDRKNLIARAKRGDLILIDVRPVDEFNSGHIPFAQSVPISELKNKLKNFNKQKEIVAYCRGHYCFYAKEAVEFLISKGFSARRLQDSVCDWELQGIPLVKTD